jgi:hypothetical protein
MLDTADKTAGRECVREERGKQSLSRLCGDASQGAIVHAAFRCDSIQKLAAIIPA